MPNPTPPDKGAILRQIPSVDELLATADGALFRAKSAGRNTVVAAHS